MYLYVAWNNTPYDLFKNLKLKAKTKYGCFFKHEGTGWKACDGANYPSYHNNTVDMFSLKIYLLVESTVIETEPPTSCCVPLDTWLLILNFLYHISRQNICTQLCPETKE